MSNNAPRKSRGAPRPGECRPPRSWQRSREWRQRTAPAVGGGAQVAINERSTSDRRATTHAEQNVAEQGAGSPRGHAGLELRAERHADGDELAHVAKDDVRVGRRQQRRRRRQRHDDCTSSVSDDVWTNAHNRCVTVVDERSGQIDVDALAFDELKRRAVASRNAARQDLCRPATINAEQNRRRRSLFRCSTSDCRASRRDRWRRALPRSDTPSVMRATTHDARYALTDVAKSVAAHRHQCDDVAFWTRATRREISTIEPRSRRKCRQLALPCLTLSRGRPSNWPVPRRSSTPLTTTPSR